jgi:hypothetical protein
MPRRKCSSDNPSILYKDDRSVTDILLAEADIWSKIARKTRQPVKRPLGMVLPFNIITNLANPNRVAVESTLNGARNEMLPAQIIQRVESIQDVLNSRPVKLGSAALGIAISLNLERIDWPLVVFAPKSLTAKTKSDKLAR